MKGAEQSANSCSDVATRNLQNAKRLAAQFGEIVGLLMRSPGYQHYSLSDLEWMIVPPLLNNQVLMAHAKSEEKGLAIPVGIAVWASVSDDVSDKLATKLDQTVRLHPSEWRGGDNLWLIDVVGPPPVAQGLIDQLSKTALAGKSFRLRHRDHNGRRSVRTIEVQDAGEQSGADQFGTSNGG